MLIITRKRGESFTIGDNIKVVVLETGSETRIGIEAPRDVQILRDNAIVTEKQEVRGNR